MKYYYPLFLTLLLVACQPNNDNSAEGADKVLNEWADAYFNFDYKKAMEYMTPESGKWIRFAASNITEKDIEFIKAHEVATQINIHDGQITEGDTIYNAKIHVSNFIQLGIDADHNQVIDEDDFHVQLVKRSGDWLIRTEGLPRSGKQSRD